MGNERVSKKKPNNSYREDVRRLERVVMKSMCLYYNIEQQKCIGQI